MIADYIQPPKIIVNESIELVKYYPLYKKTLQWYQDLELCRQVDRIDHPYDLDRLKRMYHYLSKNGECYYIKYKEGGRWRLVGDISLCNGAVSIVICHEYQNRHIGRLAVRGILGRAQELKYRRVEAEIYSFNEQSQRAFGAAGFKKTEAEKWVYEIHKGGDGHVT